MNTAPQLQTASDHLKESPWLREKRVSTLLASVLAGYQPRGSHGDHRYQIIARRKSQRRAKILHLFNLPLIAS
ncbi:MAG: hypothetical protein H5T99_11235 [Moorella sp. (in: Bacteria)]|nr:hypothetical protein [Moorella sp. (in: firmicutes)]